MARAFGPVGETDVRATALARRFFVAFFGTAAFLVGMLALSQPVQHLLGRDPYTTEDRVILQRVHTDLGFAELLHKIEEVLREVGFKCDDELLVVEPER